MKAIICAALCLLSSGAYAEADKWYVISAYGDRCHAADPAAKENELKAANNYMHTVPLHAPNGGEVVDEVIVTRNNKDFVYFRDPRVCEFARREVLARGLGDRQL